MAQLGSFSAMAAALWYSRQRQPLLQFRPYCRPLSYPHSQSLFQQSGSAFRATTLVPSAIGCIKAAGNNISDRKQTSYCGGTTERIIVPSSSGEHAPWSTLSSALYLCHSFYTPLALWLALSIHNIILAPLCEAF